MARPFCLLAILLTVLSATASAGLKTKAAKEAAEYLMGKFGKEAVEEGLETLTRKIEILATKYGDDAMVAIKKVGPRSFRIIEEAGEHGSQAVKLMARHGDEAIWVVAKKNRMAIFIKYGDDAAEAMMKHGEIAEPLIENLGKPAAGALTAVSKQNGRRLAMMSGDGTLTKIGRTDELLGVIQKYGDKAMDFIWNKKGALAVAATLTAFLANPQPFIDGTVDVTKTGLESVAQPLATEIAKTANWTLILGSSVIILGALVVLKFWLRRRVVSVSTQPTPNSAS